MMDLAQRLLGSSLDGVSALDRECRYIYWNSGMEQIYGLREDEVLGQRALDLLPFLAETGDDRLLQAALEGKDAAPSESRFEVPETSRSGYAESHYSPLRDDSGAVVGAIAVVRDITERRLADERMRETESRFHRMADCSPVLLWMAGTDGLCHFFNQTWLDFTGRSMEQEAGVGWAEGVHPFDFQRCMDTYVEAFNARRTFQMEYRLLRADGEYRWILDRGAPRYNSDGSFAGFIGSCTDITEQKSLEADLKKALAKAEEANRLKGEFLANISHELRTPLNAIVNVPLSTLKEFPTIELWECPSCGGSFTRDDTPEEDDGSSACPECSVEMKTAWRPHYMGDPTRTAHFLERLVQSSQHMLKVVNDLLDFAKIDAGHMKLQLEDIELADVLGDVENTVASLAEYKGVALAFASLEGPWPVRASRVKLAQVFINLLDNAIKFTEAGGSVTVSVGRGARAAEGEDRVIVAVKDTGIGIPEDKLGEIFESFRQVDGSHTRAHQGTGLGLSISKQLIELHGGEITVESRVGEGSTFNVCLPCQLREGLDDAPARGSDEERVDRVRESNGTNRGADFETRRHEWRSPG